MPHILVQHTEEVAQMDGGYMLGNLRKRLRRSAKLLSVKNRKLLERDFSFMFLQAGEWDSLVCDIQVIILAHADEVRVERSDELAELVATAVEEAIRIALEPAEPTEVTFSVSLHLGEMGYFASSAELGEERIRR